MKFKYLFLLMIASLLLLIAAVMRPAWSPGVIENDLPSVRTLDEETRNWLEGKMRVNGIPGLSLAVVKAG